MPELKNLEAVEEAMYLRIRGNSFSGAARAALIAGIIGAVCGAALGAAIFFGFPQIIPIAMHSLGEAMAAGALAVAAITAPIAARLGGIAGIQSTRDARRFMHADQVPALTPSQERERQQLVTVSDSVSEQPSSRHFTESLSDRSGSTTSEHRQRT